MRVFITGASSGLGEAMALEYGKRHAGEALVLGLVARRESQLNRVAAQLGGITVERYAIDVNDRLALSAAANEFIARHGVPDVVIANAGNNAGTAIGEPDDAVVFESIIRTNLIALSDTFTPFVKPMISAKRGTLVGMASVAGVRGLPGVGAYSSSKAAVIAFLECLRVELRGTGVAVVTIAPGFIRTPMTAGNHYKMPFLTDADVFARHAVTAIAGRRSFAVIPWPMGILASVLRLLPNFAFDALFANAPRKARH